MALNQHSFTLNTGAKIPAIGLGTWRSKPNQVRDAVSIALKNGYRHIDTALAYGNEKEVGEGIKDSGIPREEFFLTTKLDNPWHDRVREGLEQSLTNLQVPYLDLYLMHWPVFQKAQPDGSKVVTEKPDFIETWAEMQKLLDTGKVKAIGVSNFDTVNLEKLLNAPTTKVVPAVNQIELHPYLPQRKLLAYMKEKGILATGYSPLGSLGSPLWEEPKLKEIAEETGKDPALILLAWGIQHGWPVIPKSVTPERIISNHKLDFTLTDEQLGKLDSIEKRQRTCGDDWLKPAVVFHKEEW